MRPGAGRVGIRPANSSGSVVSIVIALVSARIAPPMRGSRSRAMTLNGFNVPLPERE